MTKSIPFPTDSEKARALRSSYFCYSLAFLVMCFTAWVIVQGIEATEPNSPARDSKIAVSILLLVLEGCVFSLAGQWFEHTFVLRALGLTIFALQIVVMTLTNYSIGATAGKSAEFSVAMIKEITDQSVEGRKNAETLREAATKLNKSKHGWLNQQGGQKATEAAQQTSGGTDTIKKLENLQAASTSTPIVETIGKRGLFALSCAFSLVLEIAGIVLMHVGGSLKRKAAVIDGQPVELQILELLHEMRSTPPHLQAPQLAPSPAPISSPAVKPAPTGPTYSSWATGKGCIPLATFGALGVLGAGGAGAVTAPAQQQAQAADPVNDYPPALVTPVNLDPPAPLAKARKTRVGQGGAVMDTGVSPHDGYRYRRALAGVKAGTMRPSRDGLYAGVGASPPIAKRYIQAMSEAGEIVSNPHGSGWVLAPKGGPK